METICLNAKYLEVTLRTFLSLKLLGLSLPWTLKIPLENHSELPPSVPLLDHRVQHFSPECLQ